MIPKQKPTTHLGFYIPFEEQLNHQHPLLFWPYQSLPLKSTPETFFAKNLETIILLLTIDYQ